MSRANTRQAFAERAGTFLTGAGSGGGATSTVTRDRDLAAYDAMRAAKPLLPPNRRPREATASAKTGVADSAVSASKPDSRVRARDLESIAPGEAV